MSGFKEFAKKNWFGLLSAAVSAGILTVFLLNTGDWKSIVQNIADINPFWLAATVLCTAFFWLADGLILHRYIRLKYKKHRYLRTLKSTVIGFLYNSLTPFASGGQPMQVYDMAKSGVTAGDAASFVTVKSIVYQICLTVYAVIAAFFTVDFFSGRIPFFLLFLWLGLIINAVFVAAAAAVIVNKSVAMKLALFFLDILMKLRIVKNRDRAVETVTKNIALFNESFRMICNKKKELLFSFAVTVAQLTLYYSLTFLIYKSFNLSGDAFYLIISAQAILTLVTAFVPMPGSSGVVEAGFYIIFDIFFTAGTIMPAVFIWRFLTYYLCILMGGIVSILPFKGSVLNAKRA